MNTRLLIIQNVLSHFLVLLLYLGVWLLAALSAIGFALFVPASQWPEATGGRIAEIIASPEGILTMHSREK